MRLHPKKTLKEHGWRTALLKTEMKTKILPFKFSLNSESILAQLGKFAQFTQLGKFAQFAQLVKYYYGQLTDCE